MVFMMKVTMVMVTMLVAVGDAIVMVVPGVCVEVEEPRRR